ncbi:MAG: two-component sensor histidine kinase [Verrucomicrobiales bacterium]|jgi:two-component sensor histidine kinase
MASPIEIARHVAGFDAASVEHMQRLIRTWGLLSDLGLGDVLVLAPSVDDPAVHVVLANVRPSTAATMYTHDPIGDRHRAVNRPLVDDAWRTGELQRSVVELGPHFPDGQAEIVAAPFSVRGERVGVVLRERRLLERDLLQLEKTYLDLSDRLMQMIADGYYPFIGANEPQYGAPRVGDGLLVLDSDRRVIFQSPNAVSALHRLGIHRAPTGHRVDELGLDDSFVRTAFAMKVGVTQELERRDVTVTTRCLPLITHGEVGGGFILMRDVSELKRRDRLLLSKDATIREIHHRVKNNLQTISSLLRLQARRVESEEGKLALYESVRRIGAIAIVHETLANDASEDAAGDDAPFEDVARPLIRLIEEGLQSPEDPIRFVLEGEAGRLPLIRSMPLAVVLTELLQNVVDHAFPAGCDPDGGRVVTITFETDDEDLMVSVSDNGHGPPEGFDFAEARGLGLTLVHTFVTTELNGTITMTAGFGPSEMPGTSTMLRFPRTWEDRVSGPALDG